MRFRAASKFQAGTIRWPWLVFGLVAIAIAVVPIGFDEAAWSVVAREWFGGAELYVDTIDNKTPILLGLIGVIDLAPGPFPLARSLVVAGMSVVLWSAVHSMATDQRSAHFIGAPVVFAGVVGSTGLLTTELLAVTVAVAALAAAERRPTLALGLVALAPALDPRMVVLWPGLAWWLMKRSSRPARIPIALAVVALGGLAVVLVDPDYRFALIDLNVRGARLTEIEYGRQILAMVRVVLPARRRVDPGPGSQASSSSCLGDRSTRAADRMALIETIRALLAAGDSGGGRLVDDRDLARSTPCAHDDGPGARNDPDADPDRRGAAAHPGRISWLRADRSIG